MGYIFSRERTIIQKVIAVLFSAGVQALIIYRIANFLNKYKFCRKLYLPTLLYRLNQFFCHVDIEPEARIGKNFLMPHPHGIVIGGTAYIGDNVTIMHNVTIGAKYIGETAKRHATIENNVIIATGSIIIGAIKIGKNAKIGAGSIILANVKANQTVTGVHK